MEIDNLWLMSAGHNNGNSIFSSVFADKLQVLSKCAHILSWILNLVYNDVIMWTVSTPPLIRLLTIISAVIKKIIIFHMSDVSIVNSLVKPNIFNFLIFIREICGGKAASEAVWVWVKAYRCNYTLKVLIHNISPGAWIGSVQDSWNLTCPSFHLFWVEPL